MSTQTPKLRVRFHGRFLFVKKDKDLIVLAVNMDRGESHKSHNAQADLHNVFMTVRERHVARKLPDRMVERKPTYRLFGGHVVPTIVGGVVEPKRAGNLVPYDGANLVWNIAQCDVGIQAPGAFVWAEDTRFKLADLAGLSDGRKLDEKYLRSVTADSATTAIIRLHTGEGRAFHELPAEPPYDKDLDYKFVRASGERDGGCLADLVEVIMDFPEFIDVTFGPEKRPDSRVRLQNAKLIIGGPKGDPQNPCPAIGVTKLSELKELKDVIKISTDVVLAFSNLCTASTNDVKDSEFAAFYNVLVDPPHDSDRFVPTLKTPRADIRFMGDCYLGATIAYTD